MTGSVGRTPAISYFSGKCISCLQLETMFVSGKQFSLQTVPPGVVGNRAGPGWIVIEGEV